MSFSLLRVPKTAALTVWSGLAVGTSCTLVLVVEDRRRRINQARSAVHNAERIRGSKQYHASVLLLDDAVAATKRFEDVFAAAKPVVVSTPTPNADEHKDWSETPTTGQATAKGLTPSGRARAMKDSYPSWRGSSSSAEVVHDQSEDVEIDHVKPAAFKSRHLPSVRPWKVHPILSTPEPHSTPSQMLPTRRISPRKMFPPRETTHDVNVKENVQRINKVSQFGDEASLYQAVELLRASLLKSELTAEEKSSLGRVATELCLKCQDAGMMDSAMRALSSLVELGPITEADYFAANPQPVIDHAISVAEAKIRPAQALGWKAHEHHRLLQRKRMERTIMLVLPRFITMPVPRPEVAQAAERCMNLALDLENMSNTVAKLYFCVKHNGGDPDGSVLVCCMKRLHEQKRYRRIVNLFHLNRHDFARLQPPVWRTLGDIVTDAVDQNLHQDAAKVLLCMVQSCPNNFVLPDLPLRTTWMTKLLDCHWKRVGNFEKTLALLQQFDDLGGFDKIVFKDGMYRAMIQIAVDAQQWQELDNLLKKLLMLKPSATKEARILGLLALAKARLGDWDAVWEDYMQMENKEKMGDVFAPTLREFMKTHTIRETEVFLKAYIQDIKMPISPYVVGMIANRYGSLRDYDSFLDWLSWCSNQGFEVDSAFGNAIIHNCRRNWDCSFEDLERIYHTLQELCPTFVDSDTESMVVSHALRKHGKGKAGISFLKNKVGFANRKFHPWTITESASDRRLDLKHAFATRDYTKVLSLYRQASSKWGIEPDEGHLRFAIRASLKLEKPPQHAIKMLREAKDRGLDVSQAITMLFILQLRPIFLGDTSDKDLLLRRVQNCISRFDASALSIGYTAQLRVAHQLLQARHFAGAISFGMSALSGKGVSHPDDIPTFQLFLAAYGYLADVRGLRWTLVGAVHQQYCHKRAVYKALQNARNSLAKQISSPDVIAAKRMIQTGLDLARQRRMELANEREHVEGHALDIMSRAALEAENQPSTEEAINRRNAMIAELQEKAKLAAEKEAKRAEEYEADMQKRKEAAEAAAKSSQADAMEALLAANKHELHGDF